MQKKDEDPDAFLADIICHLTQANQFSKANNLLHTYGMATEDVEEEIKKVIIEDDGSAGVPSLHVFTCRGTRTFLNFFHVYA